MAKIVTEKSQIPKRYQKQIKKAFNGEDDKVVDDLIQYLMNYTMVLGKE